MFSFIKRRLSSTRKEFVAIFTLMSKKTGRRFTFKVETSAVGGIRNVYVMHRYRIWRQIGFLMDATSRLLSVPDKDLNMQVRAFNWFWRRLMTGKSYAQAELRLPRYCPRCNMRLTVPESQETGLGPVCSHKLNKERFWVKGA